MFTTSISTRSLGPSIRGPVASWLFKDGKQMSSLNIKSPQQVNGNNKPEPAEEPAEPAKESAQKPARESDEELVQRSKKQKLDEEHKDQSPVKLVAKDEETNETTTTLALPIAAFDLDSTLVKTKSGSKFPRSGADWQWLTSNTLSLLQKAAETHVIVVFSNQGAVVPKPESKSLKNLHERVTNFATAANVEVVVYCALKSPDKSHRKPQNGMWGLFETYLAKHDARVDYDRSYFVGDAAGRKGDFSDSDKEFAKNSNLKFYTPEEWADLEPAD